MKRRTIKYHTYYTIWEYPRVLKLDMECDDERELREMLRKIDRAEKAISTMVGMEWLHDGEAGISKEAGKEYQRLSDTWQELYDHYLNLRIKNNTATAMEMHYWWARKF